MENNNFNQNQKNNIPELTHCRLKSDCLSEMINDYACGCGCQISTEELKTPRLWEGCYCVREIPRRTLIVSRELIWLVWWVQGSQNLHSLLCHSGCPLNVSSGTFVQRRNQVKDRKNKPTSNFYRQPGSL